MTRTMMGKYLLVPIIAVAVLVLGYVTTAVAEGGVAAIFLGKSSNSELCSAYSAAERSWDNDDFLSQYDTADIESLASVAKRYSKGSVKAAGKSIDSLPSTYSYSTYSSAVSAIKWEC